MGKTEMKAIIMAAGPTYEKYGFPPDSKPKCLFHYKGEVILERQVRTLIDAGINDIRIVAGYKIDEIEDFNKAKNLGLEVLYNPTAASDKEGSLGWVKGIETAWVGIEALNDDALLLFGDVLLTVEGLKIIIEDEYKCLSVYSGSGYQLYKIPKRLISYLRKYNGRKGGMMALHDFCMENGGIRLQIGLKPMKEEWLAKCKTKCVKSYLLKDVDYYYQTDEGISAGITGGSYRNWLNKEKEKGRFK